MTDNDDTAAQNCLNCGARLSGRFCTECGQDSRAGRLKFREILANVADELFKLDLPIARTLVDLTWRPGYVASEYVAGRRQAYTNPLKYCLMITAISVLMMQAWPMPVGTEGVPPNGEAAEFEQAWLEALEEVQAWVIRLGTIVTLLLLPIQAALTRLFFLRAGRNFAEHCALALYIHGHWYLFTLPLLPFAAHGQTWALVLMQVIALILFPLAASGFFPGRLWSIIPRALLALMLYLLAYLALFIGATAAYVMVHSPEVFSPPV